MKTIINRAGKLIYFFIATAGCLSLCNTVYAAVQDELWQKAIKIAAEAIWVPGVIVESEEVFDAKGNSEEFSEYHTQATSENDAETIVLHLVKYLENEVFDTELLGKIPVIFGETIPLLHFSLKDGSTAINKGDPVAINNINDGFVSDGAPDLGAYEYGETLPHYWPRPIGGNSPQ